MAKVGRPTKYTEEVAAEICKRLSDGESLRHICGSEHLPDRETIRRWLRDDESFRGRYARAREDSADAFADRMLSHCDDMEAADSMTRVQGLKESSQNLRWLAAVMKPRVYGDLQKLEHSGAGGAPLNITIKRPSGEVDD